MSESSVVIVLLHEVFGRPLLRFPVGVHLRATFGIESCGIRRTWPNHLNLCFCIWVLIGDEFVLLYRSSLDILFGQNMLQVLRRHLVWNTSSLFISSLETLQLCHPYSNTDMTLLLKSRSFVFKLYMFDFHMLRRLQ